ncbi:class I SAM-dependent methyltransferase [Ochrovirga pacifica]|uniref:class I SAM-dependent methyltransferase n=1 Tax=Ochrovirga pacifica TaxID=1042376 RepID=UPI00025591B6|nr:class I SAM-dependent methyltransferase [Ochrovirga pacifica]
MGLFKTILNTVPRPWLIKASYLAKPLLNLWYKGATFIDPINQKSYRKFLPYGYQNQRENVLAPGTLSLERHRLMWLYLTQNTHFFNQSLKVLHVAPEQCFYKKFRKQNNLDYTTTDLESPLADVKADICNLPFKDNTYDVVFCNHVLEHIPNDAKAMSELHRVLKPGGWGIFQVPQNTELETTYEDHTITQPEDRKKHFGQYDHVRIYGLDYFTRLKNAGFTVQQFKVSENFTPKQIQQYSLMANEILPVCFKK